MNMIIKSSLSCPALPAEKIASHDEVERANGQQWQTVMNEEAADDDEFRISGTKLFRERVANRDVPHVESARRHGQWLQVREESSGQGQQKRSRPDEAEGNENAQSRSGSVGEGLHRTNNGGVAVQAERCQGKYRHPDGRVLNLFSRAEKKKTAVSASL